MQQVKSTVRQELRLLTVFLKDSPQSFKPAPTDPLSDEGIVPRARTRRSEMKNVAVSLTDPHTSQRCAHHGCCCKGSCRSAWLALTYRLWRDHSNGGVLNG